MLSSHTKFNIVNTSNLPRSELPSNTLEVTEEFSSNMYEALNALRKLVFKNDLKVQFVTTFLNDLKNFCVEVEPGLTLLGSSLAECRCASSGNFNRFERTRRQHLEQHIVNRLTLPTNEALNFLSIGSGRLLQDLILVFKLIEKGYTNINMHFVDGLYETAFEELDADHLVFNAGNMPDQDKKMAQVEAIAHLEPRAVVSAIFKNLTKAYKREFTVHFHQSAQEYFSTNPPKCHIISAIDFDGFYKATMQDIGHFLVLTQHLIDSGEFCLATPVHNLYFNNKHCTLVEFEEGRDKRLQYVYSGLQQACIQDALSVKVKKCLLIIDSVAELIQLLPLIMRHANNTLHLTIVNNAMEADQLETFKRMIALFVTENVNIDVKFILDLAGCERDYDLVFGMSNAAAIILKSIEAQTRCIEVADPASRKSGCYQKAYFDDINEIFPNALIAWISPKDQLIGFVVGREFYAFDTTENRAVLQHYQGRHDVVFLERPAFYANAISKLNPFANMSFDDYRNTLFAFGIFSSKACKTKKAKLEECIGKVVGDISSEKDTYLSGKNYARFSPLLAKGAVCESVGKEIVAKGVVKIWRS